MSRVVREDGYLHPYTDRTYRSDDERLDAAIHDHELRALGVIEDDEPSEYSHYVYMRAYEDAVRGEFSPGERERIRTLLGIGPFAPAGPTTL